MKGSGLANVVRAAPVNAEERLLKFGASVSDKKMCFTLITVLRGIGQGGKFKIIP
jgi:hypothetical protein